MQIDFVDIDFGNWFIRCIYSLKNLKSRIKGNLPKIVVCVHLGGTSCDMKAIKKLSEKYGFKIIEDASHTFGGTYFEGKVGLQI